MKSYPRIFMPGFAVWISRSQSTLPDQPRAIALAPEDIDAPDAQRDPGREPASERAASLLKFT